MNEQNQITEETKKEVDDTKIFSTEKWKCPKCGWECGETNGLISDIDGATGRWCLRCYIREIDKIIPKLEKIM